jgi:serine-type D-Ala-D-Ala carboxypeptidase (penicillin-binding protein 5/6)
MVNPSATIFAAPGISAENAVLMEFESGRVLFEKSAHEKKSIASITKIMTAIIAIEYGDLNDIVTISDNAARSIGSSIYLKAGEKVKLKDLVYGLMLRSGNDAAVAIAEHIGGSVEGFAYLMNEKAKWIGMQNSHFVNPSGLEEEGHYSTAYDMALLMRYAMNNKIFAEISGTKQYQGENEPYPWYNKNKLLTKYYKYCIGGKTGYTRVAGRTLVTSAEKNGMKLIAVTLNASSDWRDHTNLYEWGFQSYELQLIKNEGDIIIPLPDGTTMKGEILTPVVLPLTDEEIKQLEHVTFLDDNLEREDQGLVGKQVYKLNDQILAVRNIMLEAKKKDESFLDKVKQIFYQISGVSNG